MPPVGGDPVFPVFPEKKKKVRKRNQKEKSKAIVSDEDDEDVGNAMDEDQREDGQEAGGER